MMTIAEIVNYINTHDDIKVMNEYVNDTDKYYITKNGKRLFVIRWYHYEHLQGYKHNTELIGDDICLIWFDGKLTKWKDKRHRIYYGG
jgi:hypothetical protein